MSQLERVSPERRSEILDALRRGTVPAQSLELLAVGLERFESAVDEDLDRVAGGRGLFKAVRGEYGSGKTFFARWLQERALAQRFAVTEVQVSEAETPLHRLETVYRRLVERLSTMQDRHGALRGVVDGWFYTLEEDVLRDQPDLDDEQALLHATNQRMEQKLASVSRSAPAFAACLRAYRTALSEGEHEIAEGLLAWLGGQPNVAARAKRYAGIKGDIDHYGALSFLQGLLIVLRDSGYAGLVWVLDEIETLQRVRGDVRDKGLNAIRQLMDELDGGRFPGLYLMMTGTPPFFDGHHGVQRLQPLAQRLHVDLQSDSRFDNPRAVQIRLPNFDLDRLRAVGLRVRDLYWAGSGASERIARLADDGFIEELATAVTGELGGKVGVAPRVFLKKLVADVLDRVDQFPDFDPHQHYALTVDTGELTAAERKAMSADSPDDIDLKL